MLGIYFVIILILFIILIVGAVIGYSQSLDKIKDPLLKSMQKYKNADAKVIKDAWDNVQKDVNKNMFNLY